jgi:hypothetical protein
MGAKYEVGKSLEVPPGKVRRRDRVPYRKATKEEVERRVLWTKHLLARRAYGAEIVHVLRNRYGVSRATCWVYIRRAKDLIREEGNLPPPEARDQAVNFYISVIRDDAADLKLKMEAQGKLDWIYGVGAPPKAPVNPDGTPAAPGVVNVNMVRTGLVDERCRDLLAELAERTAGLSTSPQSEVTEAQYGLKELPPAVEGRLNGTPQPGPSA